MSGSATENPDHFSYEIIRSHRKTIALIIDDEANIIVRTPQHVSTQTIKGFVHKKSGWIKKKQQELARIEDRYRPVSLADGKAIPYCGRMHTIRKDHGDAIRIADGSIFVPCGWV